MNLSDRIALFNDGRIEQLGRPEALYRSPETLFAARFLGDSTVFTLSRAAGTTAVWEGEVWSVDPGTVSGLVTEGRAAALVVRPEDVRIAADRDAVPPGTNAAAAIVREIEYMGAYRTAMLSLGGASDVVGRARLDALESDVRIGQPVVAWWRVERQRIVAV